MEYWPFLHDTRCRATAVSFTDDHVKIELADGRVIGMPLSFFPWLEAATSDERQGYSLHHGSVYWESIDEGIDLTAMLTGLYLRPQIENRDRIAAMIANRDYVIA